MSRCNVGQHDLVNTIAEQFNNSLKFDPSDLRMAYVVRDPIINGESQYEEMWLLFHRLEEGSSPIHGFFFIAAVFHVGKPRGFCHRYQRIFLCF